MCSWTFNDMITSSARKITNLGQRIEDESWFTSKSSKPSLHAVEHFILDLWSSSSIVRMMESFKNLIYVQNESISESRELTRLITWSGLSLLPHALTIRLTVFSTTICAIFPAGSFRIRPKWSWAKGTRSLTEMNRCAKIRLAFESRLCEGSWALGLLKT